MKRCPMLLMLLAALPMVVLAAGCSCRETQPGGPNVVVAKPRPKPQAQPQAAQGQAAEPEKEKGVGNSILRAPGEYYTTVVVTAPRHIKKELGDALTNKEVREFNALEGRYPYSLKELEEWRGAPLPEAPKGYTYKYDSTKGEVSIVPID